MQVARCRVGGGWRRGEWAIDVSHPGVSVCRLGHLNCKAGSFVIAAKVQQGAGISDALIYEISMSTAMPGDFTEFRLIGLHG